MSGFLFFMPDGKTFNINGQLVDELQDHVTEAGKHTLVWNASATVAWIYFIKIERVEFSGVRKVFLVKYAIS